MRKKITLTLILLLLVIPFVFSENFNFNETWETYAQEVNNTGNILNNITNSSTTSDLFINGSLGKWYWFKSLSGSPNTDGTERILISDIESVDTLEFSFNNPNVIGESEYLLFNFEDDISIYSDSKITFRINVSNGDAEQGTKIIFLDSFNNCKIYLYETTGGNAIFDLCGGSATYNASFIQGDKTLTTNTITFNGSYSSSLNLTNNPIQNIDRVVIVKQGKGGSGSRYWNIPEISMNLFNGTNSLPSFNASVPIVACMNTTTQKAIINISIDAFDIEDEVLYYATGINVFDEGIFFTEFNLNDCDDVDIYQIENDYIGIFQASYNEMGNGVSSLYYDDSRKCVIEIDESSYNSTVGSLTFDKNILVRNKQIQNYEPNTLFKTQFNSIGTKLNILWTSSLNKVFNNVTILRSSDTILKIFNNNNNVANVSYDTSNFTQWKFTHSNNDINIIVCEDFFCNVENTIISLNDTFSNQKIKDVSLIILNNSIYLDDLIYSSDTFLNFSTTKPEILELEGINKHTLRIRVTDASHLNTDYNEKVYTISTFDDLSCYEGKVTDVTSIEFNNPNNLEGIPLLFAKLIWLIRLPYYILNSFGMSGFYQAVGVIILIFSLATLIMKGRFTEITPIIWYLFLMGTLLFLMLALPLALYIFIVLLFAFHMATHVFKTEG